MSTWSEFLGNIIGRESEEAAPIIEQGAKELPIASLEEKEAIQNLANQSPMVANEADRAAQLKKYQDLQAAFNSKNPRQTIYNDTNLPTGKSAQESADVFAQNPSTQKDLLPKGGSLSLEEREAINPEVAAYQEGKSNKFPTGSSGYKADISEDPTKEMEIPEGHEAVSDKDVISDADHSLMSEELPSKDLSNASKMSNEEKLATMKKLGLVAGAGALGTAYMMNKGGQQPPAPPSSPEASKPEAKPYNPDEDESLDTSEQDIPATDEDKPKVSASLKQPQISKESSNEGGLPKGGINIDFGQGQGLGKDALKAAMQVRNQEVLMNRILQASDLLGTSLAKAAPHSTEFYQQGIKDADNIITQFGQMQEQEKHDPNSAISKGYKEIMKQIGVNITGNANAADLEKMYPNLIRIFEAEQNRQARHEDTALRYATLAQNKQFADQTRADAKENSRYSEMGKRVNAEIASSRSAFGKASNVIRSAEAVQKLAEGINPDNLDERQITEMARNLDAMLSSGQATVSGMNNLLPKTAQGDFSKIKEYIMGVPKGAQQAEFVKRFMDTVQREKQLAQAQILRTQGKLLAPYADLRKKDPERYKQFLEDQGIPVDMSQHSPSSSQAYKNTMSSLPQGSQQLDPKIDAYAKQYNLSYQQAEAILRKRGYGQ